ncbi:hypothetical protein ACQJBY_022546 [Aegilops geniculata]
MAVLVALLMASVALPLLMEAGEEQGEKGVVDGGSVLMLYQHLLHESFAPTLFLVWAETSSS